MKKGKIIAIEGTDYSGKKTQTKFLIDRLKRENIPCETISFPRYNTPTGKIIGGPFLGNLKICPSWFESPMSLNPRIASLYYAADRADALEEINETINSGKHLILDRYVESSMAHQGAKAETEKEKLEVMEFVSNLEYGLLKIPKSDWTIFLNVPLQVVKQLIERKNCADRAECDNKHLEKSIEAYKLLADRSVCWTKIECAPDNTINSLRSPEDIAEEVYSIAKVLVD